MEKRVYMSPLVEVAKVKLNRCLLEGSPEVDPPVPPHPGAAPERKVF